MPQGITVTQLKEIGHRLTPFDNKKVGGIFFEQPDHTLAERPFGVGLKGRGESAICHAHEVTHPNSTQTY
jgi:hypothetical protein